MKLNVEHETRHLMYQLAVAILGLALSLSLPPVSKAQDQQNQSGDPAATSDPAATPPPAAAAPDDPPAPPQNPPAAPRAMPPGAPSAASNAPVPDSLTLPAGTVIVVRTHQWLSSDQNHPGDIFYADLDQPLVANGWVVARRGQPVTGHVDVAQKAGHGNGDNESKLGIELAQVNLVDGQQLPVTTELIQSATARSQGRDAATLGATTAAGTIIGAAAGSAPIGAAAGIGAGIATIMATPGRPTVIPPESVLTFRLQAPVTVSTTQSQVAFRPVGQGDFGRDQDAYANDQQLRYAGAGPGQGGPGPGYPPYAAYPPPPYYYYGYCGWGCYPPPLYLGFYGGFYGGWGFRGGGAFFGRGGFRR